MFALTVRRRYTIVRYFFLLSNCNINKKKQKSRGNLNKKENGIKTPLFLISEISLWGYSFPVCPDCRQAGDRQAHTPWNTFWHRFKKYSKRSRPCLPSGRLTIRHFVRPLSYYSKRVFQLNKFVIITIRKIKKYSTIIEWI